MTYSAKLGSLDLLTQPDFSIAARPYGARAHRGLIWKQDGISNLAAGALEISDSGRRLVGENIPGWWWNADVIARTAPLTIKRWPADLVALDYSFAYGDTGCQNRDVPNYTYAGLFDSAGITKYMPQTGERGDIGLITDVTGLFMATSAYGPMLAWAQASSGIPNKFRDETTGRPIDLIKYPSANAYDLPGYQGIPFLYKGPVAPNGYGTYGGDWNPQQAHYPELSYYAYIATQDEGFLEDLQYSANFTVLCDAGTSNQRGIATVDGELRGKAWAGRNLFMAHIATKDYEALCAARGVPFPAYLQPSGYWKKLLDQMLSYYMGFMSDPLGVEFGVCPVEARTSPWMQDYWISALAFGVLTGHSDWEDLFLRNIGNAIGRTSGKSGYPPGCGTTYRINYVPNGDPSNGLPHYTWAQAFAALRTDPESALSQADYDRLIADPLNGGKAVNGRDDYNFTTRAVLVMADVLDKNGKAKVRKTYGTAFDLALHNSITMFLADGVCNARVSVVSGTGNTTIPDPAPEDPPETPPTGEPPMKTFAELSADVHAQSNVIDSAVSVLATIVARLKAMAEAAAGNSINPADVDALAQEIEAHTASLGGAIANVPAE